MKTLGKVILLVIVVLFMFSLYDHLNPFKFVTIAVYNSGNKEIPKITVLTKGNGENNYYEIKNILPGYRKTVRMQVFHPISVSILENQETGVPDGVNLDNRRNSASSELHFNCFSYNQCRYTGESEGWLLKRGRM